MDYDVWFLPGQIYDDLEFPLGDWDYEGKLMHSTIYGDIQGFSGSDASACNLLFVVESLVGGSYVDMAIFGSCDWKQVSVLHAPYLIYRRLSDGACTLQSLWCAVSVVLNTLCCRATLGGDSCKGRILCTDLHTETFLCRNPAL